MKSFEDSDRLPASRLWRFCGHYGVGLDLIFSDLPWSIGPVETDLHEMPDQAAQFASSWADETVNAIGQAAAVLSSVERAIVLAAVRGMGVKRLKKLGL